MIRYISEKGDSGRRRRVDIPDRMLSNFDRRAYKPTYDDLDLENFLTSAYKRRSKDVNTRFVHVENEKIRHSKANSKLNLVRGAVCIRDRYLCQLQLYHDGHGGTVNPSLEEEETLIRTMERKEDDHYAPGFTTTRARIGAKATEKQFEESMYSRELDRAVMDDFTAQRKLKTANQLSLLSDSLSDALTRTAEAKNIIKEDGEDSKLGKWQSTYIGAKQEVKKRVDNTKREIEGQKVDPKDLQITFRGLKLEDEGCYARSVLKADRFRPRSVPEFDVGWDEATIPRIF